MCSPKLVYYKCISSDKLFYDKCISNPKLVYDKCLSSPKLVYAKCILSLKNGGKCFLFTELLIYFRQTDTAFFISSQFSWK